MTAKIMIIAVLVMIGGCAPYHDIYQEQLELLPQHYSQFDLKMAWEVKVTDTGTVIDGVVKNVRYFEMIGVEIWVSVLDGKGNTMGRSESFIIPLLLRENDTAPFSLTIPARAAPGTTLLFTYRYREHEGHDNGQFWMQSFEVPAPAAK